MFMNESRRVALFALIAFCVLTTPGARSQSGDSSSLASFTLGATAGSPMLLGLELTYVHSSSFEAGLSFGSFPINDIFASQVALDPIDVDLGLSDPYKLYPEARFQFTGFSPYLRYYPGAADWYLQLAYTVWRFSVAATGDLRNETTGAVSAGLISGNLLVVPQLVTLATGWRFYVTDQWIINFGFGVSYVGETENNLNIGGSVTSALPFVPPSGQTAFDDAKAVLQNSVNDALNEARTTLKVLPSAFISTAIAF